MGIVPASETLLTILMGLVAVLYATAGQAGGSGFVAVMTFAAFPPGAIRATAFALNIVAAAYATLRVHRAGLVDWRLLRWLLVSSLPAALLGGMIALQGAVYYGVTGAVLFLVSLLMLVRVSSGEASAVPRGTAVVVGAVTGLASGITGVGGGVFLSSILILVAKASPKQTAALSPPYIVANSLAALIGTLFAGQSVPVAALPFAAAAVFGSAIGTAIGLRWMSPTAIKGVLAIILLAGGVQMLVRAFH